MHYQILISFMKWLRFFLIIKLNALLPTLSVPKSRKVICFMPSLTSPIERTRKNQVCCDAKQRIFQKNVIHETTWYK